MSRALKCFDCGSKKLWKNGVRETGSGPVQRWLCRNCGYRFSQSENHKKRSSQIYDRQVCALVRGAKNLVEAEIQTGKRAAGATRQLSKAEAKGKLVEYSWWMKKQGYADSTIRGNISCLRTLYNRGADLYDPESVKEVIARQNWSSNRRRNVINAYSLFLKLNDMRWEKPKCKVTQKIPFIPSEQELDALIIGCGKKTSTFLQLLKETAIRAGEAKRLQ